MNIAIVDDEPVFLKQLHNRLREMKLPDCEIHEFTSGRDLLSFYVKGMYEVIILDVEMPDLTGLQTAERIRQIDGSVIISFLTNYAEFAVKGYDVGAFRYILKNQPDYVYTKQLNSIIAECQQRFRTFTFNNKNLSFKFRLTDILYFEGHRRKVSLFTVNGELEYGGDFSTVCGELLKYNLKLSIILDTLTARILKLSSNSQSRIEPVPFYSWWDTTDRRADSAVAPVAHKISPDHRF